MAEGPAIPVMDSGTRPRHAYLDNLKVVLVVGVILGHVLITYADVGTWAYRETSVNDAFLIPSALIVALGSLFAMGVFFLIAGLLTPGPLERKGPAGFLLDRTLRLGVPFLVFLLLLYPTVKWVGERGAQSVDWFLRQQLRDLDPGPLWFVLALLVFSVGYVVWRQLRHRPSAPRPMRPFTLVAFAVGIAVATFVTRLWFPIDSRQVLELHVWQWPQCIGMFVLGLACAENGWLQPVPGRVRRRAGVAALIALAAVVVAFAVGRDSIDPFAGGPSWQAVLVAACEGALAVGLAVWLLGVFQAHADHAGRFVRAMGRAAFGAYIIQAAVVIGLAVLLADWAVAPEVKALVVAPLAVAGSFGLAWLLTQVPGVGRFV
jgi:fucose 4-O-acetylase-like acetyltransferase